jgi:hypothetical protein
MLDTRSSAQFMPILITVDAVLTYFIFSQKLPGEFTALLILFRISQQLSEITLRLLFPFIAFPEVLCTFLDTQLLIK